MMEVSEGTISLIITYYRGSKYLAKLIDIAFANYMNLGGNHLEVIIVNDSPDETVDIVDDRGLDLKVINMAKNSGIHSARAAGIRAAKGAYILLLDQDDELSDDCIATHYRNIKDSDTSIAMSVSDAIIEIDGRRDNLYKVAYHKKVIDRLSTYLYVGTQIRSPGQCLIKRESISDFWLDHPCKKNGADDFYLWITMLERGYRFSYIYRVLYTHCDSGENLSSDQKNMDDSMRECLSLLAEDECCDSGHIKLIESVIDYKDRFRSSGFIAKLLLIMINPEYFIINVIYKIRTKTKYGYGR